MEFFKAHHYSESHTSPHSELLEKIQKHTIENVGQVNMLSGHLQGRLLSLLSHMRKPRRVLEIGTFTGYATICLAEGLQENGIIHTLEKNPQLKSFHDEIFGGSQFTNNIKVHYGDANHIVPQLDEKWDLVFLDAAKRDYIKFFEILKDCMNTNGVILADNVLWKGEVYAEKTDDKRAIALKKFAEIVNAEPNFESVMLPIRDGLMCIRYKA